MKRSILLVACVLLPFSTSTLAKPPECKEPGAPKDCFEKLRYKLTPIDVCDQAPIYDPETGRVTYPCGFKVKPISPKAIDWLTKKKLISPVSRYMGSTIHHNGDGTSTIDHGGSATETINTADAQQVVKDYKSKGITIIEK